MLEFAAKSNFRDFTLDVEFKLPNGIHCLFGASGAGKSISLKILAGLLKADSQEIKLKGNTLASSENNINLSPQKRRIGFVFQRPTIFPNMNVLENIVFGLRGNNLNLVNEILEILKIDSLKLKGASQLSGGQAQRVSIARTLVNEPELILLDEPFTALDTPLRVTLRRDLKQVIKKMNIPMILVTHDLLEALDICEHMIMLDQGKVIQQGKVDELMNNPINDIAKKYLDLKSYEYQRPL